MRYLIRPTKNGWYASIGNAWKNWSIKSGWFTPIDLLWHLGRYNLGNPRYVSISILGFNLEIGKFEKKPVNNRKKTGK